MWRREDAVSNGEWVVWKVGEERRVCGEEL